MALQADELNLRAGQHPRIYRSVRLVTGAATFDPHRRVFENKWASEVAMAFHAARFIGIYETHVAREVATVRVVAIHARHGALRQAVPVRPLELAQTSVWHFAQSSFTSTTFLATSPCGPFLWIEWQAVQLTWFLA